MLVFIFRIRVTYGGVSRPPLPYIHQLSSAVPSISLLVGIKARIVAVRRRFESPINPLGGVIQLLALGELHPPSNGVMRQDEVKFLDFVQQLQ